MMRDHRQLQELLAVYPQLEAAQKAQVDAHLPQCSECQAALNDYANIDLLVRRQLQTKLQFVTAHPGLIAQPSFAALANAPTGRTPWLDDLLFRLLQPRPLTLRLVAATALLLLVMALSTLFGGWLPFEQPVMASTPTQVAAQATEELRFPQSAITYTPTATPTAISLVATLTPIAIQ